MIKIEKVAKLEMSTSEIKSFLVGWYRVVEEDGSTIAYTPDKITANQIQDLIELNRFGLIKER